MDKDLQEILDALQECDFYCLNSENYYDNVICYFKHKYKKSFSYDAGASKLALIFKNFDYVIKIPFSGSMGYNSSNDSSNSEFDEYYDSCEDFCNAGRYDNGWNYCQAEADVYENAKDFGIEDCFAKTEKIAEINSYPIYKQEYVKVYDYGASSCHTPQDKEKVISLCKEQCFWACDENWLADVLAYFGEKIFNKLIEFIQYMEINDLHNGNIGYINLKPVLMDYSGWND